LSYLAFSGQQSQLISETLQLGAGGLEQLNVAWIRAALSRCGLTGTFSSGNGGAMPLNNTA
jgi:hypothetical protein